MQAIRILVQKARLLQEEIVSQGKGTASEKEFYKRNHRWTDGFISAAKAVDDNASITQRNNFFMVFRFIYRYEKDAFPDESIFSFIGDCFVAKSKSAPRNDI